MDNKCPICLIEIDYENGITTKCSHNFHHYCLDRWLDRKTNCPICRTELEEEYEPLNSDSEEEENEPLLDNQQDIGSLININIGDNNNIVIPQHPQQNNQEVIRDLTNLIEYFRRRQDVIPRNVYNYVVRISTTNINRLN